MTELQDWCGFDLAVDSLTPSQVLFPCSRVWPMGYSWSSTVAQDVSLGLLRDAGFAEEQVFCVEEPPPLAQGEVMFVLTDDCIMAHTLADFSAPEAEARVARLDGAIHAAGGSAAKSGKGRYCEASSDRDGLLAHAGSSTRAT